jgi:hypothetical protein
MTTVFAAPGEPLEIHLFDAEAAVDAMADGPDELVMWKAQAVSHVCSIEADPPLGCFTCGEPIKRNNPAYTVGFAKHSFKDDALVMGFCAACGRLPKDELSRRVRVKLGPGVEVPVGNA